MSIVKQFNEVANEMERVANLKQKEQQDYAERQNDAPCAVCNGKEFIQKFRNVVGEVSGSVSGYFTLFGGSIHGRIDGHTKTLPILSCRNCENEREIVLWNYVSASKMFWEFMHNFYFIKEHAYKIDKFFLERPLGTREYMLKNKNYTYDWYNEMTDWSTERWAEAGFNIKKITKKSFFFKKEVYPAWEDYEKT